MDRVTTRGFYPWHPRRGMLGVMGDVQAGTPEADPTWLEKARAGDRSAFERIVESYLPRVWGTVWRILRQREDTEDVVQEVFLTAFQSLPGFRGDASLSTWLHRIAVTRALNHLDRSSERIRRASRPLGSDDGEGGSSILPEVERAASSGRSPLRSLEARELLRRLSECLGRLPAAWRAVVALRDAEALPYEEIAERLGVPVGTVRSRLARARLSLRECVEGRG